MVSAGERPARIRGLVARLAVVRREDSECRFVLGDDIAGLVFELVEKPVPADVVLHETHGNRKLLAALLESEVLGPTLERLEVGIGNLHFDASLRAVALGGDLDGAFLLVLALLEDVAAYRIVYLVGERRLLKRRTEYLHRRLLAPAPASIAHKVEVERELAHEARPELVGVELEAHEIERRADALAVGARILKLADVLDVGRGLVERLLYDVDIAARAAVAQLGELRPENRLASFHRYVGAQDVRVEPAPARNRPVHVLWPRLEARARQDRIPHEVAMWSRLVNLRLVDGILGGPYVYLDPAELLDARADRKLRALFEKRMRTCGIERWERIRSGLGKHFDVPLANNRHGLGLRSSFRVHHGADPIELAYERAVEKDKRPFARRIGDKAEGIRPVAASRIHLPPLRHALLDVGVSVEPEAVVEIRKLRIFDKLDSVALYPDYAAFVGRRLGKLVLLAHVGKAHPSGIGHVLVRIKLPPSLVLTSRRIGDAVGGLVCAIARNGELPKSLYLNLVCR